MYKASHFFNLWMQGVLSVSERAEYIKRVRDIAKLCCEQYSCLWRKIMSDFLIEFYSEEMPASFLEDAAFNIKNLLKSRLSKENIYIEKNTAFFTPKRITVIFHGVKLEIAKAKELIKGPNYNSPDKAIEGFAKSVKTVKEKLIVRDKLIKENIIF